MNRTMKRRRARWGARSSYDYAIKDDFILVMDNDGSRSVTNDMEGVGEDMYNVIGPRFWEMMFMYKDSMGLWTGVSFDRHWAPTFVHLNSFDLEEAKVQMVAKKV
jgi:hypothetical protein